MRLGWIYRINMVQLTNVTYSVPFDVAANNSSHLQKNWQLVIVVVRQNGGGDAFYTVHYAHRLDTNKYNRK